MKTKEELNALKEEVETMNKKLAELTEEELAQVAGGYTGCYKTKTACDWGKIGADWDKYVCDKH